MLINTVVVHGQRIQCNHQIRVSSPPTALNTQLCFEVGISHPASQHLCSAGTPSAPRCAVESGILCTLDSLCMPSWPQVTISHSPHERRHTAGFHRSWRARVSLHAWFYSPDTTTASSIHSAVVTGAHSCLGLSSIRGFICLCIPHRFFVPESVGSWETLCLGYCA